MFLKPSCYNYLVMKCAYCKNSCIKFGLQKSGLQKFFCKDCKKYQQSTYVRKAWLVGTTDRIQALVREGLALRGIARILNISLSTVISKIKQLSTRLVNPVGPFRRGHIYEIDELWTFVGSKANEVC